MTDSKAILREQEQALRDLGEHVAASLPNDVLDWSIAHGELTVSALADRIVKLLTFLRDDGNCQFTILVDVLGVDWPERPKRFDVVYHLLSMKLNQRIRVKVQTDEETPVPSVTGVFSSAGWFEREVWDMYGVMFSGHPDLRRILSDYGFEGHALRKDFPLTGYVEVRYDEEQKRVVYEPVQLQQEFRRFDFMSPWEGAQYVLPGDEKADEGAK
ncbi:NADH-quinone oxidoreductase subunit C [Ferrovibrio sp.]|uniref:NADH-quinone oxidoreductase subunit C n=1 Tax=Ferrovibrio sp. TaxID=1917215 RepID=UPI00311F9BE0